MFLPPKREDLCSGKMPQLNGGGGDDLGANDEMISFKDEGEQEEKISENSSAERDLADVKSSLVNESETNQNSSSDSEVSLRLKIDFFFVASNRAAKLGACVSDFYRKLSISPGRVRCNAIPVFHCISRRRDGLRLDLKLSETKQEKV